MINFLDILFNLTSLVGLPYYGVAIILFTIIIKIILFPLTYKQTASMRKMMELTPMITDIQKKYAKDKVKANQKVMELYAKEKANPYMGCLPLLIQMPILWAFYKALMIFPYGNEASAMFLGFNLTVKYGFTPDYHLILPIAAGLSTYLMSKTTSSSTVSASQPESAKQTQKIMLIVMPFFLAYITASVPSGLGIYIITMNIVSAIQTLYINNHLEKQSKAKSA
nr:YidC/Oxa1 family membrane protein insertase [Syntrophobotulus glycolicus]